MGHTTVENDGDHFENTNINAIPLTPLPGIKKNKIEPSLAGNADNIANSCVLVVGTTGTGKTSTVNIFTGNDLRVGDSAQAVTGSTIAVEDQLHPGAPVWIDNPGWSDTEGRSDNKVFKELLHHMQDNKLYNVAAVVWCVLPQPRMDALLQSQARFIEMFTTGNKSGRIWSNVLIVCKGKLAKTSFDDCQGARMAAKKANVHADPKYIGYEFARDEVLEGVSEKLRKETLRMLTIDEIRQELEVIFESLPPCIQVVFANQKCQACGQTGDSRLMEDKCHRNKKQGHIGKLEQRFSKAQIGAAAVGGVVGVVGLSTAAAAAGSELVLLGLPLVMGPGAVMSGHRFLNTSAEDPAPCGGVKITDMRWSCCDAQELSPGGCTDLCDLCGATWGTAPPCVLISHPDSNLQQSLAGYEVHVKKHDLIDMDKEDS